MKLGPARSLPPLPKSFLFGVGNSDHQCEAYDPEFEDIRDVWDKRKGLVLRGLATDFWNRYPEDIQHARSLGCKMFRFSVSWARIEPSPGQFNEVAIRHYRDVVEKIQQAGMKPFITLHHFTWPLHVEKQGGMTSPDFPALFARYASVVASHIGSDVPYWVTFNEPSIMVFGYLKPWWEREYFFPPGLPLDFTIKEQLEALADLIHNLFMAHTQARVMIKRINPQAKVGANPSLLGLPTGVMHFINRIMTRVRSRDDWVKQGRKLAERVLLETGKADVVLATLTMSFQRAERIDFSQVYYVAGQALLAKEASPALGIDDLTEKTIAVVKTSTAESTAKTLLPKSKILSLRNHEAALEAIESGRADALMSDDTILAGILRRYPVRYRVIAAGLTEEPYAAGVLKGNPEWLNVIDHILQKFKESGSWAESYSRHFPGKPVPIPPDSNARTTLSDTNPHYMAKFPEPALAKLPQGRPNTVLRRIQDRGFLIVAVKENVPGLSFRDPQTGEWSGLEIDLARAIALRVFGDSSQVVFRPVHTRERIPLIRSVLQIFDPILKQFSILTTVLNSNWWHLGMAGQLAEFLCPNECVGQQDFVGFDYYWGISALRLSQIKRLFNAVVTGRYRQAPVWPGALYKLLKYHSDLFPGEEILIIENGCVHEADGISRAQYILKHVREVQRARRTGINVVAYICWSITSNREWGAKFERDCDFGLYHIELDTDPELKRIPTSAVSIYQEISRGRGIFKPARRKKNVEEPDRNVGSSSGSSS